MKQILVISMTIMSMSLLLGCAEGKITDLNARQAVEAQEEVHNEELPPINVDDLSREEHKIDRSDFDDIARNAKRDGRVSDEETPRVPMPDLDEPKQDEPKQEVPTEEVPKVEQPKVEQPKEETPKVEVPKEETPKEEQPKEEPKQEEPKQQEQKKEEPKPEVPKQTPPAQGEVPAPSQSQGTIVEKGFVTPTIYYFAVLNEDKSSCPRVAPMLSKSGRVLISVCMSTYKECRMEGSCGIVQNNKLRKFNVVSKGVFMEITDQECSFGFGVKSYCLDPFYTVAADLSIYKAGDVIFINAIRGTVLPDGTKHSGYFVIRDMGHGINGKGRFDFYSGTYSHKSDKNPFKKLGLGDKNTKVPFVRLKGVRAEQVLKSRAFPGLPVSPIQ